MNLLDRRRNIPLDRKHRTARNRVNRELKHSLKADRETWWNMKAEEMEIAHASGNVSRLFKIIRSTGPKRNSVSENILSKGGESLPSRLDKLGRWAEHFRKQFSWPEASGSTVGTINKTCWDIELTPFTENEVSNCIRALKVRKAAGPDELAPIVFKEASKALVSKLTELFSLIWNSEDVPEDWGQSIIVPIFKKGNKDLCENYRGISLTPVISRIFASLLLNRLSDCRESRIREEQAGFRKGRGCIDHIFTLRQVLELRRTYHEPTVAVFLDFRGAFDSVDRTALFKTLLHHGVPTKYVNLIRSIYSYTSGKIRAYGELSDEVMTRSGVRQGCPLSPFLFNFVMDEIMKDCLRYTGETGVDLSSGVKLCDLDYADDKVLLFSDEASAQSTLDRLVESIRPFGMQFAPSKCKMLMQDCSETERLSINGTSLDVVDNFVYSGSCISSDGKVGKEIENRISKATATFAGLRHLWHQKGISLGLKVRVYKATVRAVLLYGCETWPIRSDDLRRLEVFDHRCLRSIAHIRWDSRVSNREVRRKCFGESIRSSIEYAVSLSQFMWLGHTLRMHPNRLSYKAMHATPGLNWRKRAGVQFPSWQKVSKDKARQLGCVGHVRLPGWGPRDSTLLWLEIIKDMAANRNQWRACCSLVAESAVKDR